MPVVAPLGTVVVIFRSLTTTNELVVPLNRTTVVPVKWEPLIVTAVPTDPLLGLKLVMWGAVGDPTVKFVALVSVPAEVVSEILPVVAPDGTVAVT